MAYQPPFQLTHTMSKQLVNIGELIGAWKATHKQPLRLELRRDNRIKTIQASLAIEQNTLSIEQVTAVLAGKTVLGQPREIQEVLNAFAAYESGHNWHPHSLDDLLAAHALLMRGLVDNAGQLRDSGTGIFQGNVVVHVAPPANQLPRLMEDLLTWLKTTDAHPLIASAAFHYDFEFIHPFSDGNGRMGRLWQTLILSHWEPMLAYLPVETVIKHRQQSYYQLLGEADKNSDCSAFIEFLLAAIESSLEEAMRSTEKTQVETLVQTLVKTPEKILALLQQQPQLTLAEVASHIGLSTSAVERAVAKLKQQQKLSYHGSKKSGTLQVHKY